MACVFPQDLANKTYVYRSKKRTLTLFFENDSICRLRNVFRCNDIDEKYREVITICRYKKNDDLIYLRNIECKDDNCNYGLALNIPIQNSVQCNFLNKEHRRMGNVIAPNYITDYRKFGLIPAIDIDTLYIKKNKIMLYKQYDKESIGFIFK